jgi:thioredoxin reductase (NADPH)
MTDTIHDLIIIGGGPGGLTAGIYAKRAALDTVLFEKGQAGGQIFNTEEVENYPGFQKVTGPELAQALEKHAQGYELTVERAEVAAVEPHLDAHAVHLEDGTVRRAHAVILATGGRPNQLKVPGEDEFYGRGVSYCATCDGFFFRNQIVAVVGGGDAAAEEALYLAKITEKVFLIHRRDQLRASRILQERVLKEPKIEVLWNRTVAEVKADQAGVNQLVLRDVASGELSDLSVTGLFIFVGFTPNNQLTPQGVKLSADGYVVTDDKCMTSIDGIFAVGDNREKFARQIVTAAADGCVAALAAAHYVENRKARA